MGSDSYGELYILTDGIHRAIFLRGEDNRHQIQLQSTCTDAHSEFICHYSALFRLEGLQPHYKRGSSITIESGLTALSNVLPMMSEEREFLLRYVLQVSRGAHFNNSKDSFRLIFHILGS